LSCDHLLSFYHRANSTGWFKKLALDGQFINNMVDLTQQKKLDINQLESGVIELRELAFRHTTSAGSLLRLGVVFALDAHNIPLRPVTPRQHL
jgi:hypothetical protein